MTATAHINCGGIRFDQLQLPIEGRHFLALGTSTFTLHNSFAAFKAQVVGLADVRVKFTRSPTGSSLPPPSSFEELESQNSCHQALIRRTPEPYSCSGMLHTRYEIGHSYRATHRACSIFATAPQTAKAPSPPMCSCRTQKRRAFSGYSCSKGKAPHLSQDSDETGLLVIPTFWSKRSVRARHEHGHEHEQEHEHEQPISQQTLAKLAFQPPRSSAASA